MSHRHSKNQARAYAERKKPAYKPPVRPVKPSLRQRIADKVAALAQQNALLAEQQHIMAELGVLNDGSNRD